MRNYVECARKRALPFLAGAILGGVWTYYCTVDPNRDFDPEAAGGYFCWRNIVARAPMPGDSEWGVTAYREDCDFFGSTEIHYVYLLRSGQTIARSTLVISYEGSDPILQWKDKDTLVVHAKVYSIIRQVIKLIGVTVEYDLKTIPLSESADSPL